MHPNNYKDTDNKQNNIFLISNSRILEMPLTYSRKAILES